ncbi:IS3 family transposase [Bacillus sp. Au-Bac7]|uniref:IS3 family transposase n=1 Tax=Bacillus sp. Au-Bac7 TaxID=2906458 RepID=UPI003FA362F0
MRSCWELETELHDYIHCFNHIRTYETLGYINASTMQKVFINIVQFSMDITLDIQKVSGTIIGA